MRMLMACLCIVAAVDAGVVVADDELAAAWQAWETGEIARAGEMARETLASAESASEARHLLFLTRLVAGDYEGALAQYGEIGAEYERLEELDGAMIDCYLHLGRAEEAEAFARERGLSETTVATLDLRTKHPMSAQLSGLTVVPFAEHPLTAYFPAFAAEIDGREVTVHIDTGGT